MAFSTPIFLFYFLPATLLIYYLPPALARRAGLSATAVSRARNAILLGASCVFYGWWNPYYVVLMLFVTAVNYGCGRVIVRPGGSERLRWWGVAAAVALSLGTLGTFKYAGFLQANVNQVLGWLGAPGLRALEIALPVGISFYTFQALSYSVDLYRGTAPPARSFLDCAAYIALFPQLLAGPIVRYNTVAGQLQGRSHTLDRFAAGAALFVLGFAKKVLLANPVGEIADAAFAARSPGAGDAWFGAAAYAFQIYFDFSGYSDMAIGLARMVGFEFMKNFDSPYLAESITDFWRRWHISLSTFLREYLYIPLGGNRRGQRRTYLNLWIVMLLGGLWHGANWTFVLWGAYHGALLAFERRLGKRSIYGALPRPVRVAGTFVLVLFAWVLFRAANIGEAAEYFGAMFGFGRTDESTVALAAELYGRGKLIVMAACAALILSPRQAYDWAQEITLPKALVVGPLLVLSIMAMFAQAFKAFLYFQF